ncbi:MAG: bis(5'-nucleosyl)-tetraphosphatase (symmetrical) YqeK [Candidatus Margulisbacteria bacterium]|nr:bis(5'-nucleosyl)-tetraphosphatase (symmetrical) YqeK [Candidatus Margulisiibacteriota bacterium]
MLKRSEIIKKLESALDSERFKHSLRVEKAAVALAQKHGVSVKKASQAALLHDYARKYDRNSLLKEAKKLMVKIDDISRFEPKLLHADISAILAQRDFGISDKEVLSAIRKHTVGSPRMTKLEKIIYLADHVEEGRDISGLKQLRKLALRNLNKAIVESTSESLAFLLKKGAPINSGTIQTRNYYLLNK